MSRKFEIGNLDFVRNRGGRVQRVKEAAIKSLFFRNAQCLSIVHYWRHVRTPHQLPLCLLESGGVWLVDLEAARRLNIALSCRARMAIPENRLDRFPPGLLETAPQNCANRLGGKGKLSTAIKREWEGKTPQYSKSQLNAIDALPRGRPVLLSTNIIYFRLSLSLRISVRPL